MQGATERKFASIIARKNTEKYINRKLIFGFSLLILIGIICGVAVFDAIYRGESYSIEYVRHHFYGIFDGCTTFSDYFSVILMVSKSDIRTLFFVFVAGFTYFCSPASGIMVFSKGFLSGFAVFYLVDVLQRGEFDGAFPMFWIFVATKIILCIITVHLAMSSYIFAYKFREIKSNSSILRRAPITYKYAFIFVYSVGGVLMTNYAYCFLIYNFIK